MRACSASTARSAPATISLAANTELAVAAGGRIEGASSAGTVITGSAGAETITVAAGATLVANGNLGDGDDVLDVAGTLDTVGGALLLGAGDDRVRIHETTVLGAATVDAGAGNDLLDVNVTSAVTLGATTGFESLGKSGVGTLNVLGANTFATVEVNGGLLQVANTGSLQASDLTVASGATLRVDGTFTGTSGNDTADIAGIVSGVGSIDFGGGDDVVTLVDGANLASVASVTGGAGNDSLIATVSAGNVALGPSTGFESLQKTGGGLLTIGSGTSEFADVSIGGGTVRVDGTVNGMAGGAFDTTLAAGATLEITASGAYGCGSGDDSITVGGTVTGSGRIDQCAGNDTLRIQDGANFASFTGTIDGGADTLGDTVQLDNANALTFGAGAVINYENLAKTNTGTTTLTGTQTYSGSTLLQGGSLVVEGALRTPTLLMGDGTTLTVDGLVEGLGGIATALTGSAGANTITVEAGGTLRANGSLGDGADLLDVIGTLDTLLGALNLGDGDDTLRIHDGSVVGHVDGGAGHDTFGTHIQTSATLGAVNGFEALAKSGVGVLHLDGPGVSDFANVDVLAGTLDIGAAGALQATTGGTLAVSVASGATLHVDGQLLGGNGNDTLALGGTLSGAGTVALGAGDDRLVLSDGASLHARRRRRRANERRHGRVRQRDRHDVESRQHRRLRAPRQAGRRDHHAHGGERIRRNARVGRNAPHRRHAVHRERRARRRCGTFDRRRGLRRWRHRDDADRHRWCERRSSSMRARRSSPTATSAQAVTCSMSRARSIPARALRWATATTDSSSTTTPWSSAPASMRARATTCSTSTSAPASTCRCRAWRASNRSGSRAPAHCTSTARRTS